MKCVYLNLRVALACKGSMYYVPMPQIPQHYLVEAERRLYIIIKYEFLNRNKK